MSEHKKPAPPGLYEREDVDRLGRSMWVAVDTNGEQVAAATVTREEAEPDILAALTWLLPRLDPDVDTDQVRSAGPDGPPEGLA